MKSKTLLARALPMLVALVLVFSLVVPAGARPGGSFGGGRSFGGGFGGGRSFGGSFGGSRSSFGGSFGRSGGFGSRSFGSGGSGFSRSSGSGSFGAPRSSYSGGAATTRSGSFGRGGGFGSSGRINSTSISHSYLPPSYQGYSYYSRPVYIYNHPAYGYGGFWSGYSLGLLSNPWGHWVPFYPGFYVDPPYYNNGAYYAGGFSFTRFIFGIVFIAFIVWLISRIFRGGRGVRYTNYR